MHSNKIIEISMRFEPQTAASHFFVYLSQCFSICINASFMLILRLVRCPKTIKTNTKKVHVGATIMWQASYTGSNQNIDLRKGTGFEAKPRTNVSPRARNVLNPRLLKPKIWKFGKFGYLSAIDLRPCNREYIHSSSQLDWVTQAFQLQKMT